MIFAVSPYRADETPPGFSFDLSYSYYSPAYERPGPEVRSTGCTTACRATGPQEDT